MAMAFVDEGTGALSTCPTEPALDPGNVLQHGIIPGSPAELHGVHSLTAVEALDVSERPFIWDLCP